MASGQRRIHDLGEASDVASEFSLQDYIARRYSWTAGNEGAADVALSSTTASVHRSRKDAAFSPPGFALTAPVTASPQAVLGSGEAAPGTDALHLSEYASGISIMSGLANIGMLGSSSNNSEGRRSASAGSGSGGTGGTNNTPSRARSVHFDWDTAWPARFEGSGFTDTSVQHEKLSPVRRLPRMTLRELAHWVGRSLLINGPSPRDSPAYTAELHGDNVLRVRGVLLVAIILPVFYGLVTDSGHNFPHMDAYPLPLAAVEALFTAHLLLTLLGLYAKVMQLALCATVVLYAVLALAPYGVSGTVSVWWLSVPRECDPSPEFVLKWFALVVTLSAVGMRFMFAFAATWISFAVVEIYVHSSRACVGHVEAPMVFASLSATLLSYMIDRSRFIEHAWRREIARRQDFLVDSSTNQMRSSRAKTEFLSVVSHELRTPLTSIFGFADLLLESDLSAEQKEYVDMMVQAGQHLLGHINNMLSFSKFASYGDSAGRPELVHPVAFDLGLHLEEIGELFAPKAAEKGLELVVHIGADIRPRVIGDMALLRNVIMNLLDNGIKFTRQGEVVLRAHVVREGPDSQDVAFTISDSGIGIPAHVTAGGFGPFLQADSSQSREYGGAGLGLCICETLLRAMQSSLEIQSVENVGTTAQFTLHLGIDETLSECTALHHVTDESLSRIADLHVVIAANTKVALALRDTLKPWRCMVNIVGSPAEPFEGLAAFAPTGGTLAPSVQGSGGGTASVRAVTFHDDESTATGDGDKVIVEPYAFVDTVVIVDYAVIPGTPEEYFRALAAKMRRLHIADGAMVVVLLPVLEDHARLAELRRLGIRHLLLKPVRSKDVRDLLLAAVTDVALTPPAPAPAVAPSLYGNTEPYVVLAEHDASNRVLVAKWLQKIGVVHQAVSNGQEVLNVISRRAPVLILMDLQLPVKDGFQTTQEIRQMEQRDNLAPVPIIALSAARTTMDQMLASGLNDYLDKPLRMSDLVAKVQFWMAHGGKPLPAAALRPPTVSPITIGSAVVDVEPQTDHSLRGFMSEFTRRLSGSVGDARRLSTSSEGGLRKASVSSRKSSSVSFSEGMRKASISSRKSSSVSFSEGGTRLGLLAERKPSVGGESANRMPSTYWDGSTRKTSLSESLRKVSLGDPGTRKTSVGDAVRNDAGTRKSSLGEGGPRKSSRGPARPFPSLREPDGGPSSATCIFCLDSFRPATSDQDACPECARIENLELKLDEIADRVGSAAED